MCGLQRRTIQKRLLTEDANFEKALQIAQGKEAAETDAAQINRKVPILRMGTRYTTPQVIVTSLLTKGRISAHLKYHLI